MSPPLSAARPDSGPQTGSKSYPLLSWRGRGAPVLPGLHAYLESQA